MVIVGGFGGRRRRDTDAAGLAVMSLALEVEGGIFRGDSRAHQWRGGILWVRRLLAFAQAEFGNISIVQGGAVGGGGVGERRKSRRGVGGKIGHDGAERRSEKGKRKEKICTAVCLEEE